MPLGKTIDNIDVHSIDVAELLQAIHKGSKRRICFFRDRSEDCDEWALGRDLRSQPVWPHGHRTANKCDEIAPSHCAAPRLETNKALRLQQGLATGGIGIGQPIFALQQSRRAKVRVGSFATFSRMWWQVRSSPESRPASWVA